MQVFVVSEHNHYESGDVRGVFDSLQKAKAFMRDLVKGYNLKGAKIDRDQNSITFSTVTYQIDEWEINATKGYP